MRLWTCMNISMSTTWIVSRDGLKKVRGYAISSSLLFVCCQKTFFYGYVFFVVEQNARKFLHFYPHSLLVRTDSWRAPCLIGSRMRMSEKGNQDLLAKSHLSSNAGKHLSVNFEGWLTESRRRTSWAEITPRKARRDLERNHPKTTERSRTPLQPPCTEYGGVDFDCRRNKAQNERIRKLGGSNSTTSRWR